MPFGFGFPLGGQPPAAAGVIAFGLGDPFVNNAVLQRGQAISVWGLATPGDSASVTIDGVTRSATANGSGVWVVSMPSHAAGGPYTLVATRGASTITRTGIYYGEVILLQGQSNQLSRISEMLSADITAAEADCTYPLVRMYEVPTRMYAATPQLTCPNHPTAWLTSSISTVDNMPAIGWLAARDLHKLLGGTVAVGIILAAEGGSSISHWLPSTSLQDYVDIADSLPGIAADSSGWGAGTAMVRYNGTTAPIGPYGVGSYVWYQGEAAAAITRERASYRRMLVALKAAVNALTLSTPKYYVIGIPIEGIPGGGNIQSVPVVAGDTYPYIREAQQQACADAGLYPIVTSDGDPTNANDYNLHPQNKPLVAARLLLSMREHLLADGSVGTAPVVSSWAVVAGTIELTMSLSTFAPSVSIPGFAITDASKTTWFDAVATKSGSKVVLSHASVPTPAYWRHKWADLPLGGSSTLHETTNLLPLETCRGDVDYEIQVTNGTGDGRAAVGASVAIAATLSAGQGVSQWDGDVSGLANRFAASTTLTMPSHDVDIVARIGIEPAVAITSPTAGAVLPVGTPVNITVTQSTTDPGGSVASVEILLGAASLGFVTLGSGTGTLSWTPTAGQSGAGSLTARAVGSNGVPKTSAAISVSVGSAVADAIAAIQALGPTVFRLSINSASYIHEDATNPGHTDQVIDLVASPSKDLTNATDATQPYISTVGSDGAIKFVRGEGRFLTEPAWGSAATAVTEALAFRFDLNGVTQYVISRDANERSWVHDVTNIFKFTLSSLSNYVASSALDTNPHLAIATYDGTDATPANRAKMYIDGVDDTHITGTIPTSLPALTAARWGMSTAGTTEGSTSIMAYVGFTRLLSGAELTTLRTNLKVLCPSLP